MIYALYTNLSQCIFIIVIVYYITGQLLSQPLLHPNLLLNRGKLLSVLMGEVTKHLPRWCSDCYVQRQKIASYFDTIKGGFHTPTTDADERYNMAVLWNIKKN